MFTIRTKLLPIVVCIAFGLAACSSDSKSDGTTTIAVATTVADTTAAPDTTVPATSATDAPDTSVGDTEPDGVFTEFTITINADGWLIDPEGRSIYISNNDEVGSGVSTCTGGCVDAWPLVTIDNVEELGIAEGFNIEDFNFIFRDEGGIQLTYLGAPLYYYAGDTSPGDQNGENVGGFFLAFYNLGG